ncbi:MAG TPA: DUF2889 domain-containing protein [Methylomirabilota bacterium]|nr:DUF2889 domain-containing protein [Methylomirabilota bacterium]
MSGEAVHVRTITMQARRAAEGTLEVSGRLVDERPQGAGVGWFGAVNGTIIHDMRVSLAVRHPDLVITAVTAEMASHPYSLCPDAVDPLQQLVGLPIGRGFTRALNERFGRQLGCAHLTALIHAMAPVVRQAVGPAFRAYEEIPKGGGETWFVNSCQAWKEGGLLHQRLAAGDVEGLKALSARAPTGAPDSA